MTLEGMNERRTQNDVRLQARQGMLDSYRPMNLRQKLGHYAFWRNGKAVKGMFGRYRQLRVFGRR